MLEPIKYEHVYTFDRIPLQWLQGFEIFYPDLTNFPVSYVHFNTESQRVYGFPVSISVSNARHGTCSITVSFLCNKEQSATSNEIERQIKKELEGRFGISNPLTISDLEGSTSNYDTKNFLKEVWKTASKLFGDSYPYGKLYDEMYSIVRFVAAWAPKTGRQSEMRAVYNFQSLFGEKIEIQGTWNFLDFFLIPTYRDVQNTTLSEFPKFEKMFVAVQKIWPKHWKLKGIYKIKCDIHGEMKYPKYTREEAKNEIATKKKTATHHNCNFIIEDANIELFAADKGWGKNIDTFDKNFAKPWNDEGVITSEERKIINMLVSAFNRHPGRTTYFVWALMSIFHKPYQDYDNEYYQKFYELAENNNNVKGISPKVVGCFLQQGFEQEEMIPIDTWVESFHKGPLGIDSKFDFFNSFKKIGKLERLIWKVSQAKKTNAEPLMNVLWCIRFGDTGNNLIRYANPLSCYACDFHTKGCPGFEKIRRKKVLIKNESDVDVEIITTPKNKNKGKKITDAGIIDAFAKKECDFVCLTENGKPKKIFKENNKKIQMVDEFSHTRITNNSMLDVDKIYSVEDLVASLGPNIPPAEGDIDDADDDADDAE